MPKPKRLANNQVRYVLWAVIICVAGLVVTQIIDASVRPAMRENVYIPIHIILEFASIIVSFAVFIISCYGYRQTQNKQDLFVGAAFGAIGIIDFVHTLSYKGMPDFLGSNSPGKAAAFWLVARFLGAAALLVAAFVSPSTKSRLLRPVVLVPSVILFVTGIIAAISLNSEAVANALYIPGSGLTPFKILLEYLVIAIFASAFMAISKMDRGWRADSIKLLRTAIIFSIGAEVCFTLYQDPYDSHNLLGHIYKAVGYYFVLQALFVTSLQRPYRELARLNAQLQDSFRRIGEALGSSLQKDATLKQIASLARQMFDADVAAIGQLRSDSTIEITSFDGLNPGSLRTPLQQSLAGEAFAVGTPLFVEDLQQHRKSGSVFVRLGLRGFMWGPILRDGRPVGAIYVGSREAGRFTEEDSKMLTAFTGHAAIALSNVEHFEREHRIAETLQRVIFPPDSMEFGDYMIAGRYQPAWDEAQVGGDFYDYIDLGDGLLGLAIGDVSGKGLDAAVHTAIVKYSYQAYIREGFSPAAVLRRVDEAFKERRHREEVPDSVFITLFCGVLDTKTGRLIYASGGHEPPMRFSSDGIVTSLDSTGPIVGLLSHTEFEEAEITMFPGDTLILYTDGITEARIKGRMFGQNGLIDTVLDNRGCLPQVMADAVYDAARAHTQSGLQDDVAIIVIEREA